MLRIRSWIWVWGFLVLIGAPTSGFAQASEDSAEASGNESTSVPQANESQPDSSAEPSEDVAGYNLKLRAIEERVNQLKERIFQSKARLVQLQEVVLHGSISGAKAVIIHRNEMGSSFRLERAQYALDGTPIFNRVDLGNGELGASEDIEIFSGSIAPGTHQISVFLQYRGHGYGVFSYLKGYKFKIKSSYTLTVEEGKITTLKIVGYEKGGLTTKLEDRPAVRYDTEVSKSLRSESDSKHDSSHRSKKTPSLSAEDKGTIDSNEAKE